MRGLGKCYNQLKGETKETKMHMEKGYVEANLRRGMKLTGFSHRQSEKRQMNLHWNEFVCISAVKRHLHCYQPSVTYRPVKGLNSVLNNA